VIAVDGKSLRRSHDGDPSDALHMVSAFCTSSGLVLGQTATDAKSNEITAIPALLGLLKLQGAIVTIDAMGCQRKITEKICSRGGDYVIGLKDNQPNLHAGVDQLLDDLAVFEGGDEESFSFLRDQRAQPQPRRDSLLLRHEQDRSTGDLSGWAGIQSVAMVVRRVIEEGHSTTELCYFISSLEPDAEQIANAIRSHWHIENRLHWVLDVVFGEDRSRVRRDNSAHNLAVLRHIAVNLLRNDKSTKASLKSKRHRAGWDNDYLARLVFKG
jgi:predicted transposase YbfD/YdcC